MNQVVLQDKRPKAASVVFLSQILWGFAYYGAYSLLASFFKKGLQYSEEKTILMVAAYGAMGPICTFIGGVVSDRLLGVVRSYILGYVLYVIGFGMLAFSAMMVDINRELSIMLSVVAVAILSIARGTTNSTNNVIMTKSHQKENKLHLLDVSYSYNYMFNNIGSTLGNSVFPILIGTSFGLLWGYRAAFFLATGLMCLAVINQVTRRKNLESGASLLDEKPFTSKSLLITVIYFVILFIIVFSAFSLQKVYITMFANGLFAAAVLYFIFLITQAEKSYKPKMVIALIIYFQMIAFYIYYNQLFTSLMLYPINVMRPVHFLGLNITGEFTASFNAFWCVVGSPIVIGIISALNKKRIDIHVGYKFVIGLALSAFSYFILWYSTVVSLRTGAQDISMLWMFAGHAFVAIAELFILNLAVSSLSLLVPKNITATALGLKLMTMGVGSLLAGSLASRIALKEGVSYTSTEIFKVYQPFFLQLALMASGFAVLFVGTTFLMKYLEKRANS